MGRQVASIVKFAVLKQGQEEANMVDQVHMAHYLDLYCLL